jgi:hypothetical protein
MYLLPQLRNCKRTEFKRSVGFGALASAARIPAPLRTAPRREITYKRSVGFGALASAARIPAPLRTAPRRASFRWFVV